MSLIRFNPLKRNSFPGLFDEFFNRNLSEIVGGDFAASTPSVNIIEEDDLFKVALAAPGLEKQDFNIEITDDRLYVSAEKEQSKEEGEEGKFTRREFNYTSFKRSFYLPETINQEDIEANYENGVLTIELKKIKEAVKPSSRVIEIK